MTSRITAIFAALTMGLTAACSAMPRVAADGDGDVIPQMTVRGVATIDKPADELTIRLGVVSVERQAGDAVADNARRMDAVRKALGKADVEDDEISTGRYRINPQYGPRPRNATPDWRPQIVGYQVTNTLIITTRRMTDAGDILDAAVEAGANSVDSVSFGLANPRQYRSEAIRVATRNAMDDARTLAEAAGVTHVRILAINLDNARHDPYVPVMRERGAMLGAAAADMSTSITPGDVTVQATVDVVFEISQQE